MGFSHPNSAQAKKSADIAWRMLQNDKYDLTWENKNDSVRKPSPNTAIIRLYDTDIATVTRDSVVFRIQGWYTTTTLSRVTNIAHTFLDARVSAFNTSAGIWLIGDRILEDGVRYEFGMARRREYKAHGALYAQGIGMRWAFHADNTLRIEHNKLLLDIFDDGTNELYCGNINARCVVRASKPEFQVMHRNLMSMIDDESLRPQALRATVNYLAGIKSC